MNMLNIKVGNIFNYLEDKDAIINSSNQYMISGSGISGSIYKNAGKEMLENFCKQNFKENMNVNEVRVTPGFDLGIDIIHIFAPKYHFTEEPIKNLLKGYKNIFEIAKQRKFGNIISVSLGTGIHGYKHEQIGEIVVNELENLVQKYKINFTLVLSSSDIKKHYQGNKER